MKRVSNSITKNNVSNNNITVPYDLKLAYVYNYFEHSNTFYLPSNYFYLPSDFNQKFQKCVHYIYG